MANTLVQFRAKESARVKAVSICERLGLDLQTYLRICMSRLIQENGIPFSMKLDEVAEDHALKAMLDPNCTAEEYIADDASLPDDINTDIAATSE